MDSTVVMPEGDFSAETLSWLEGTDPAGRKALGQYMTARSIRERLIERVDLFPGMQVLDPGVGTGEFLATLRERQPDARLTGRDVDPAVLAYAARNVPDATLELRSALDPGDGRRFDLVIGNPPYFQFRPAPEQKKRFSPVIAGRANIFACFFQAALELVKPGGQVAFVVPPSMNNGAYFEALRRYILGRGAIEHLEILEGNGHFDGASTAVQLIVIRAGGRGPDFSWRRECAGSGFSRTVFSPRPDLIEREFSRGPTLWQLGFEAVTGTVVWNLNRKRLRPEPGPGMVPLIWSRNITPEGLALDRDDRRPQYIESDDAITGPAIVVNRVVGAVGTGILRAAPIPEGTRFLAENHVNVIRRRTGVPAGVSWDRLLAELSAPTVGETVRRLTGNTQISATELTHMLPLGPPRPE